MIRNRLARLLLATSAAVAFSAVAALAQTGATSLGSARLPHAVKADGKTLPAGTYALRLSSEAVPPVVGQTPGAAKWVELLQGGEVKGRALATVLTNADASAIAKTTPPSPGNARVELLRGGDYYRVWVNRGGTHYLLHLPTAM